jgi:tetratricopeptide (TPR) repeat protein
VISSARFSTTFTARSAAYGASIAAAAAAVVVCTHAAIGAVSTPTCHQSSADTHSTQVQSTLLDYNTAVAEDFKGGHTAKAEADINKAFAYAILHCWPLSLGNADDLFDRARYREAFQAYLGYFFQPHTTAINPIYEDAGAEAPFKKALQELVSGNVVTAIADLHTSVAKAPDFQEARLILGDVLYAQNRVHDARVQWRAALASYGAATPEKSSFGPDPPWLAALRLYELHKVK